MKFAAYYMRGMNKLNIGDELVLDSMRYIYNSMGIDNDSVLELSMWNIEDFYDESIILHTQRILPDLPSNVVPCYFGFVSLAKLSKSEVEHLKKHEPIGCRDYYTYTECISNGINAFFSGCSSVVLPKMERGINEKKKCFLVDLPDEAIRFIPDSIMKDAVFATQLVSYDKEDDIHDIYEKHYLAILNEARLVITPRLHLSTYCLCNGIPVVVMREHYAARMTTIDSFVPIYDKKRWNEVNFTPDPIYIDEAFKTSVIKAASGMLWAAWHRKTSETEAKNIDAFYQMRPKSDFVTMTTHFQEKINDRLPDKNAKFNYSVWGVSVYSEAIYDYVSNNYPYAVLVNVYDAYRRTEFHGLISKPISELKSNVGNELCIVGCGEDIESRMLMLKELDISMERLFFIDNDNKG